MLIGMTYDLRREYLEMGYSEEETGEFDRDDTIDAIAGALERLGHRTDRVGHVRSLVQRLARGDRWDLVFNIAEGLRGFGREAQVPALLEAYDIPCTFADSMVCALSLHKGMCKHVVRSLGLPTPGFHVVAGPADLAAVDLPFPLFVKPVAEGTGKGVTAGSRATDAARLRQLCEGIWERYRQPALVEEYLPGRELTVGVLGTGPEAEAVGTLEIVLLPGAEGGVYSYLNKEECERVVEYRLVPASDPEVRRAEELSLAIWRGLGCRDGGRVDLRSNAAGEPCFLEVNPLSGLHPQHSDLPILCTQLGIPYDELIRRIVDSACRRVP